MAAELTKLSVKEKITLRKFHGEIEPGKLPFETIVIENGTVKRYEGEPVGEPVEVINGTD